MKSSFRVSWPLLVALSVSSPVRAVAAKEFLEFSLGPRVLSGEDRRASVGTGAFGFLDAELSLTSPGLSLLERTLSLHALGVAEVMAGWQGSTFRTVTRIGDEVVETMEEPLTGPYLSAILGIGLQLRLFECVGVSLLWITNLDRGAFNRSFADGVDPTDDAAFFDGGMEPFVSVSWRDGNRRVEGGLGQGWFRLGLRLPSPLTDNPHAWIEPRIEYLQAKGAAFDYGGFCARVAFGGTIDDSFF